MKVALVFIITYMLLPASGIMAQTGHLKVQGEATVYAQPEKITVHIPIQSKHAQYDQCAASLTKTYNSLVDALAKSGIDRSLIKSGGLSISENFTWSDRERRLDGYIGNINASIEMDNDPKMLNAFMRTMSDDRFLFGYNMGYSLSESQKERLQAEAIALAVNDANMKAQSLAQGLGVKLLSIHEVSYGQAEHSPDVFMRREQSKVSADMESIELNAKDIEIRKSVQISWIFNN